MNSASANPRELLASYDLFMSGEPMPEHDKERFRAVAKAASFGAAAYEAGNSDQAIHALARSFLLALIDPSSEELDYLRADPASGAALRAALTREAGQ